MKTTLKITGIALTAALISPLASFSQDKVIYGEDNRTEYFSAPAAKRELADSVVSLWKAAKVTAEPDGSFRLATSLFGDRIFNAQGDKLCPSEPHRQQPIGAHCSGTLIGPDLVMTAGHCIDTMDKCEATKFVFGFGVMKDGAAAPSVVPAANVYSCKAIVAAKWESSVYGKISPGEAAEKGIVLDMDYAIIQLDRRVTGRKPLPINRRSTLAKGSPLVVIGHPVGLPLKIAAGASVINMRGSDLYFEANLDTYGGNSGSGVFNDKTGLVEGILVRGRTDFVKTPAGCYVSNVLDQNSSNGESVTKISLVKDFIPELVKAAPESTPLKMKMDAGDIGAPSGLELQF